MKRVISLCFVMLFIILLTIPAAAAPPYKSYTYNYNRDWINSPDAYVPYKEIKSSDIDEIGLKDPSDIFVAKNGDIYIADTGNNRVVVLNGDYSFKNQIALIEDPVEIYDKHFLKQPKSIFIDQNNHIYIADAGNKRIIVIDENYNYIKSLNEPKSDVLPEDFNYIPSSIAVDKSGRVYVVVESCNMGILALKSDGTFESFLGAQKVNPSFWDLIWRFFMTKDQKDRSNKFVPTEYNNLAINERDFLFLTTSTIDPWAQYSAAVSRSKDTQFAPVKMLNPSGVDVLKRTGFFPPAGDVAVEFGADDSYGPSLISDVAIGPHNTYTLLDRRRQKLFTYDSEGNLLFAFSGQGMQVGMFQQISSISYQGDKILALDRTRNSLTVFEPTEYRNLLYKAIALHDERKFEEEGKVWAEILSKNANLDLAYTGMGNAKYQEKDYAEAMAYFRQGNNVEGYSKAYGGARKSSAKQTFLLIPLVAIVLLVVMVKISSKVKAYNKGNIAYTDKRPVKSQLAYTWHYIFHPFDGAWDMTRENRGGIKGAIIILVLSLISFIFRDLMSGYVLMGGGTKNFNLFSTAFNLLAPFVLFCIANWSLTSLMNGEGSMKNIFMVTAYSLTPIVLLMIPATIVGNMLLMEEMVMYQVLNGIMFGWMGFLIFTGTLTIHGYSLPKNIATILLSVVGMAFIIFILLLLTTLGGEIVTFIRSLYLELSFR